MNKRNQVQNSEGVQGSNSSPCWGKYAGISRRGPWFTSEEVPELYGEGSLLSCSPKNSVGDDKGRMTPGKGRLEWFPKGFTVGSTSVVLPLGPHRIRVLAFCPGG